MTLARVRTRRHAVFATGLTALVLVAAAAAVVGTGCVFDDGGYKGGGRRTGAPTSTDEAPAPTGTGTGTGTGTSTSEPPDSGLLEDAGVDGS